MPSAPIVLNTNVFPKQDYVTIDGVDSPGRATIRGAGTPRNWDKRKGYGASGAWLVFMGNDLTEFDIEIYLWDESGDPSDWVDFANQVLTRAAPGKLDKAHTIDHPILKFPPLQITQFVIKDVSQLEQDDTGGWTATIKCQEYKAPVPFVVKKQDTPDAPNTPETPQTAAQKQIAALSQQANGLSSGADKSGLF